MPQVAPVFPPGRYGHRREAGGLRRWSGLLVLLVLVVLVLAGAGFFYVSSISRQVSNQVVSFTPAEHSVRIVFEVSVPHDRAGRCVLRARDAEGAEVGRATVPVPRPRSGQHSVQVTYTLSTSRRPTTGEVESCQSG